MLEIKITDLGNMPDEDKLTSALMLAVALPPHWFDKLLDALQVMRATKQTFDTRRYTKDALPFGAPFVAKASDVIAQTNAGETIAREDSPAAGAPTQEEKDLSEAAEGFAVMSAAGSAALMPLPIPPHAPEVAQTMPVPEPSLTAAAFDSRGLPWDARIHAGTRTQNADGSWKALRGVDKALVPIVETELRAALGRRAAGSSAPDLPPPGVFGNGPSTQAAASAPPVPSMAYQQVAGQILADMAAMKVTNEMLVAACAKVGIKAFPELVQRPDLVGSFHGALYGA